MRAEVLWAFRERFKKKLRVFEVFRSTFCGILLFLGGLLSLPTALLSTQALGQQRSQVAPSGLVRGQVVAVEEGHIKVRYKDAEGQDRTIELTRSFLSEEDLRPGISKILLDLDGGSLNQKASALSPPLLLSPGEYESLTKKQRRAYIRALRQYMLRLEALQRDPRGRPLRYSQATPKSRSVFWGREAWASEANSGVGVGSQCAVGGHVLGRDSRGTCPTSLNSCSLPGGGLGFQCGLLFGEVCVPRFEDPSERRVGALTRRCLQGAERSRAEITPDQYPQLESSFENQFRAVVGSQTPPPQSPLALMSQQLTSINNHFRSEETKNQPYRFSQSSPGTASPAVGAAGEGPSTAGGSVSAGAGGGAAVTSASGGAELSSAATAGQPMRCPGEDGAFAVVRVAGSPLDFDRMAIGPSGVRLWSAADEKDRRSLVESVSSVTYTCDHGPSRVGGGWIVQGPPSRLVNGQETRSSGSPQGSSAAGSQASDAKPSGQSARQSDLDRHRDLTFWDATDGSTGADRAITRVCPRGQTAQCSHLGRMSLPGSGASAQVDLRLNNGAGGADLMVMEKTYLGVGATGGAGGAKDYKLRVECQKRGGSPHSYSTRVVMQAKDSSSSENWSTVFDSQVSTDKESCYRLGRDRSQGGCPEGFGSGYVNLMRGQENGQLSCPRAPGGQRQRIEGGKAVQ